MRGKLIIFSAPSGAGKTSIVRALLDRVPELAFSVSACSRPMRPGEVHGRDYYFLTHEEFRSRIDNGDFLEWEEVYAGNYYGTLRSELDRIWEAGKHVLFDVDVVGGLNIKNQFPANSLAFFVMPPSLAILKSRLQLRGTETPESLERRIGKAEQEMISADRFDKILVNDVLETAVCEAEEMIRHFIF
jgi:guanylate kinase